MRGEVWGHFILGALRAVPRCTFHAAAYCRFKHCMVNFILLLVLTLVLLFQSTLVPLVFSGNLAQYQSIFIVCEPPWMPHQGVGRRVEMSLRRKDS